MPDLINPAAPLELADGTPVELLLANDENVQVRVPEGAVSASGSWWYSALTGECCGFPYWPRLRNVTGAPAIPAWKFKALQENAARDYTQRVPWENAEWSKAVSAEVHFPHLELVDDVPMVAFYASEKHAEAGRKTKMRPGRYLTRYFGDALKNEEVEALTAEVTVRAGAMVVRWTQDADEIETIYVNGPRSCMSESARNYDGSCHPSRVYAGPDLAVAWLGDQDDATARAIVWPDKKVYGGVYGDVSRMRALLEAKGFTSGSFEGARVQLIEDDEDGIVFPYLDIASSARADHSAKVIVLGKGGDLDCRCTDGVVNKRGGATCDRCAGRYDPEGEGSHIGDVSEDWCQSCANQHASYCAHRGEYVAEDVELVHGGRYDSEHISESRLERAGYYLVEGRDEYWHRDSTFECTACDNRFHEDDCHGEHSDHCEGCGDSRAEELAEAEEENDRDDQAALPLPQAVPASSRSEPAVYRLIAHDGLRAIDCYVVTARSPRDGDGRMSGSRAEAEKQAAELTALHRNWTYRVVWAGDYCADATTTWAMIERGYNMAGQAITGPALVLAA